MSTTLDIEKLEVFEVDREKFSERVYKIKESDPEMTYLDIIESICIEEDIEVTNIKHYLTQKLVRDMDEECSERRMIKPRTKLNLH